MLIHAKRNIITSFYFIIRIRLIQTSPSFTIFRMFSCPVSAELSISVNVFLHFCWKTISVHATGNSSWIPPPNSKLYMTHSQRDPPNKNVWLFHVSSDPYEEIDLSAKYPDIVQKLLQRLAFYNSTAVPPVYPHSDPNCDPKLHNGFWGPWLWKQQQYIASKMSYTHIFGCVPFAGELLFAHNLSQCDQSFNYLQLYQCDQSFKYLQLYQFMSSGIFTECLFARWLCQWFSVCCWAVPHPLWYVDSS